MLRRATMEVRIPRSDGRPAGRRLVVCHFVFLFCVICIFTCRASSSPTADGPGLAKIAAFDVAPGGVGGESDAIQTIISQLSSWMKEKHKKHAQREPRFEEELLPHRMPRETTLPFVTLTYAQTLDGMIAAKSTAGATTSNLALSGPQSNVLTHRLRNLHDAVLVGGTTFLLDRPRLNVRLSKEHTVHAYEVEHPVPVVLDTHLTCLQQMLFGCVVSTESLAEENIPDIAVDAIRASKPVVCCSSKAAQTFLDILEIFQEQQATKRKPKKSYKITVYKKIDEDDHRGDLYLPIKISIRVTDHRKHEEDVTEEVTLTLLPCLTDERTNSLSVRHVLQQLHDQFEVRSVMVEGGSSVLSSFLKETVEERNAASDDEGSDLESCEKLVDCVCITIAPKIIGGGRGLPVFGGLNLRQGGEDDADVDANDRDLSREATRIMLGVKDGRFVPLGQDCIFLGKI